MYCVWQVVKTPTVILNNPVYNNDTQINIHKTKVGVEGKMRFGNLNILVLSHKKGVFSRRPVSSVAEVYIANIELRAGKAPAREIIY